MKGRRGEGEREGGVKEGGKEEEGRGKRKEGREKRKRNIKPKTVGSTHQFQFYSLMLIISFNSELLIEWFVIGTMLSTEERDTNET